MLSSKVWEFRKNDPVRIAFCLLVFFLFAGCQKESKLPVDRAREDFAPVQVLPSALPAIVDQKPVSLAVADQIIEPDELVLGIEIKGESRAYPINMLTGPSREIINDQIGGVAIAATW